jgi:DNA-binding CsgD family transcriptional regulator
MQERPWLTRHSSFQLTAHEKRIALSAAEGMTNVEIAAMFKVTRRTVEFHLTNVYRKLDITRRGELARALHRIGLMQWV